jgi:hypothetical protein
MFRDTNLVSALGFFAVLPALPAAADLITPISQVRAVSVTELENGVSVAHDEHSAPDFGPFIAGAGVQNPPAYFISANQNSHILPDGIDGAFGFSGSSLTGFMQAASTLDVSFSIDQPVTYTIQSEATVFTFGAGLSLTGPGGDIFNHAFSQSGMFNQTGMLAPGMYTYTASAAGGGPSNIGSTLNATLTLVPVPGALAVVFPGAVFIGMRRAGRA